MPVLPRGNGLSFQTDRALKELDRDGGQEQPQDTGGQSWAVGTPPTTAQTMRHPRTGQPLTPVEAEALLRAIKQRQVPQAK